MTTPYKNLARTRSCLLALIAAACVLLAPGAMQAQTTSGGTQIVNQAAATYSDGSGNNFSTVSNTVTVTVANVTGLAITPDAGTNPSVVSGQTSVDFSFTVTNSSNFSTQVRFLSLGQSIQVTGPATVQAAVIDANSNGIDGTDTDIKNNAADALSASIPRNGTFTVIVRVNVNAAASAGDTINVQLGDSASGGPSFDNQAANTSANEVRTSSGASAPANGESEARGDISATVQNDTQLRLSLNAPAGPVALGSNITYTWGVENTGQRAAGAQTLAGAPAGSNSGVFVIAPIPVGTDFSSIPALPAGVTVLYSTSAITNDPLSALTTWTTVPPATLSDVTRVAYNVGSTLAAGASVTNLGLVVAVETTINASNPLYEIGDAFATNSIAATITDQSGDAISNKGDGNANFDEPRFGVDPVSATQGFQLPTTLQATGSVLIGPSGQPGAVGPTNNNDDYTNRSVTTGIAGVAFGGTTTAAGTVDFTNTVSNAGNANDTFTLSAPIVPAGFTVAISTDGGTTFTTVSGGGTVSLAVNFGQQANIITRITAPLGASVLTGFDTVIRATSTNTNANTNDTINRLYTGFLRLQKTATVTNSTGVGGATDPVPGAVIEYSITFTNVSSSGGTNNATLTASGITISEDGNAAPNNWGSTTTQVVTPAPSVDAGGAVTDGNTNGAVTATTTFLRASGMTVAPGAAGTFTFRRTIN